MYQIRLKINNEWLYWDMCYNSIHAAQCRATRLLKDNNDISQLLISEFDVAGRLVGNIVVDETETHNWMKEGF